MDMKKIFTFLHDVEARRKGIRIWLFLVLAWSIGRSIIVAHVFHKYGLSGRVYFAIDFISSIPYAFTSAQSLLTFIDRKRGETLWWGLATIALFYAPDIYIIEISKEVPSSTYIGFGVILVALSAFAIAQWSQSHRTSVRNKKDAQ